MQTFKDIEFIKNICFKTLPIDNILPYLFYTNAKTIQHNKNICEKKNDQIFTSLTQDIHFDTCAFHFRLPIIPNQNNWIAF